MFRRDQNDNASSFEDDGYVRLSDNGETLLSEGGGSQKYYQVLSEYENVICLTSKMEEPLTIVAIVLNACLCPAGTILMAVKDERGINKIMLIIAAMSILIPLVESFALFGVAHASATEDGDGATGVGIGFFVMMGFYLQLMVIWGYNVGIAVNSYMANKSRIEAMGGAK